MKIVYESGDEGEAKTLSGLLVLEKIPNEIRNREAGPFSVWIIDDTQTARAMRVVSEFLELPGAPWTCPECEKSVNAVFDECWNCGTSRP
jgi:hypothetical protein